MPLSLSATKDRQDRTSSHPDTTACSVCSYQAHKLQGDDPSKCAEKAKGEVEEPTPAPGVETDDLGDVAEHHGRGELGGSDGPRPESVGHFGNDRSLSTRWMRWGLEEELEENLEARGVERVRSKELGGTDKNQ